MVDRLLRVHIQSQRAFGPRWTLSYNTAATHACVPWHLVMTRLCIYMVGGGRLPDTRTTVVSRLFVACEMYRSKERVITNRVPYCLYAGLMPQ